METRTKLWASSLLLLAPGGVAVPAVSYSFSPIGDLFTFSGGATKNTLSINNSYSLKKGNLKVDNLVNSVNLQEKKIDKELTLDSNIQALDVLKNHQVNISASSSASTIHKEVKKEAEITDIESRRTKKFSAVVTKIKPFLISYLQTKKKFQKLKREGSPPKQTWTSYSVPFDADDRKTILKVYEGNDELADEKRNFVSELQRSSGGNFLLPSSSVSGFRKGRTIISRALQRTGWDNNRYPEIEIKGRLSKDPKKSNNYGWLSWENNPFRHFIDSQHQFFKLVEDVDQAQKNLSSYMESKRTAATFAIILGPLGQQVATPDKPKFLQKISDAKLKVYFEIIDKLMNWMGQDN